MKKIICAEHAYKSIYLLMYERRRKKRYARPHIYRVNLDNSEYIFSFEEKLGILRNHRLQKKYTS